MLRARGDRPGDVVAACCRASRNCDRHFRRLAGGAVYQPLFTAFGPAAIQSRVTATGGSQAKLIVTDAANRGKLDGVADCPPILLAERGAGLDFRRARRPARPLRSGRARRRRSLRHDVHLGHDRPAQGGALSPAHAAAGRRLYARRARSARRGPVLERRRSRLGLWDALRRDRAAAARPRDHDGGGALHGRGRGPGDRGAAHHQSGGRADRLSRDDGGGRRGNGADRRPVAGGEQRRRTAQSRSRALGRSRPRLSAARSLWSDRDG